MWVVLVQTLIAWGGSEKAATAMVVPGRGVTVRAPDDSASLTLRGRFQLRATEFIPPADSGEEIETEILIRRARVSMSGFVYQPELTYNLQLALAVRDPYESDVPRPLLDAWVNYEIQEPVEVRAGQLLVPFSRGRVTSSANFELIDRSIVTNELNLDRDVGVTLHSGDNSFTEGVLGYAVGLYGGEGRNRVGTEAGYLGVARLCARPLGEFDDLVESDRERVAEPRLSIGVNAAYNLASNRSQSTNGDVYETAHFDYLNAGADLVFKWHGLYLAAETLLRAADQDAVSSAGVTEYSRSAWGWYAQAGQMVSENVEVAGRYSHLVPLEGTDPELADAQEVGGGASWFLHGHAMKVQTDYFYHTGETFDHGEHLVLTELQVSL
jgi:hypothetical protein